MSLQQPPQPQYSMPERDKQLLFSDFEDLSASFRSLYKSVFEQSFSQQGLMGMPTESSQQTHTACSYQHSPSGIISTQNSLTNNHSSSGGQVPLSHPPQLPGQNTHPGHGSPHTQHLSQHGQHGPHNQHGQHGQHNQHQHPPHSQHGQHPSHAQHPQHTPHPSQHAQQHGQHPSQQQHQSLAHQPHPAQQQMACNTGLPSDWYPNLDALKESCRIASSYNWADVDLSPFQGAAMKGYVNAVPLH
uniref:Forkhead box J3 n=1 Tax=Hucho hucho TaxID=62062 RepID=A0A4W5KKJ1_9TELE